MHENGWEARRGKTAVPGLFVVAAAFGHARNHDSEDMALKHQGVIGTLVGIIMLELRVRSFLWLRAGGERIGMSCRRHAELPVGC